MSKNPNKPEHGTDRSETHSVWDVSRCKAERGSVFTAFHSSAPPLGQGLFNATAHWRNMSGALFDFLSASETPAGSGNESANRTREERHATHD